MSKISFIKSDDRKYNIERCLSLIKSEIISGIRSAKNIVIRPSCFSENDKLSSTKPETLEAILSFIRPYTKNQITLAEGCVYGDTLETFKKMGYLTLQEDYDLAITDLNHDEFEDIALMDRNGKEISLKLSKTILNSDYLISIATPSTDEQTVYSGIIQSTILGSLIRSDDSVATKIGSKIGLSKNNKLLINQGNFYTHKNIKKLFYKLPIRLAVIDGFELITGDGPIGGQMVPGHFAIASSDSFATDWLTTQIMDISPEDIGYLSMLDAEDKEKADYFIIGDSWQKNVLKINMHNSFPRAKHWHNN